MNTPKKNKKKYTYYDHKQVLATLEQVAKEETTKRGHGRNVTAPELIREMTLNLANKHLIEGGKEPIRYDTSAGKFAPGGIGSAANAVVDMKGRMTVYDKSGNKLDEWETVQDIPHLLRLYPKCRVSTEFREQGIAQHYAPSALHPQQHQTVGTHNALKRS
jgi:hypothetical protein